LLRVYKYTCTFNFEVVLAVQTRFSLGNAGCTRFQTNAYRHSGCVYFLKTGFQKIIFQTFLCLFSIRKVSQRKTLSGQRKTLSSQRKIWLGFQESVFLFFDEKHFQEVVKNLEMSCYLLIISNLILKLLIAIYILFWIFVFQFHPLEFNFYINFGSYFYNCYLLFPHHFLIEIFYLLNFVLNLLIVIYFIWNNLWNVNYYYFNSFIFQFF